MEARNIIFKPYGYIQEIGEIVIMESTLFDGEILFLRPSSTLFNIPRLAALIL